MLSPTLLALFAWGFLAGVPYVAAVAIFATLPGLGFSLRGSGFAGQYLRPRERSFGWALLASALWLVVEAFTLGRVWDVIVGLGADLHGNIFDVSNPLLAPTKFDVLRINAEIAGVSVLGLASIAATGVLLFLLLGKDVRRVAVAVLSRVKARPSLLC